MIDTSINDKCKKPTRIYVACCKFIVYILYRTVIIRYPPNLLKTKFSGLCNLMILFSTNNSICQNISPLIL